MLGSASYLGLCLVCTHDIPVVDMLARSPPLPLVIDYNNYDITAEDEEAIILALAQQDRVRRIRLGIHVPRLQKLIMAIDGEYPILEHLILRVPDEEKRPGPVSNLPETLQTPRLRHLDINFSIQPIRVPLLGTAAGLVVLSLAMDLPFTYFQPTDLIQWLSLMPRLEILMIFFFIPVSNHDVERQRMRTPITTHVTLPNLRSFTFKAVSAYSEAVPSRITAPRLQHFQICYFEQLRFSVPQLLQFLGRIENLRFNRVKFFFGNELYVVANPPGPICHLLTLSYMSGAGLSTCRYPPWRKCSIRLAKCSLRWSTSFLDTKKIVSHWKRIMWSTAPSGAIFLGHLAM